jgi:N-acetylglucosamine-6-phosphate deacetylase
MTAEALTGARVLLPDGAIVEDHAVVIEGGRIADVVGRRDLPAGVNIRELAGGLLAPGFIDTQVNGGGGVLFNDDPSVEAIHAIGVAHRRFGTTGFLPTLISDDLAIIERALQAVDKAIAQGVPGVLGIHLEGPLLAPARAGIHDRARLRTAEPEVLALMTSLQLGTTLVTLAPEVVGADAIRRFVESRAIVAAGHTNATYQEMKAGFAAGVTGVTHLFNAMSPMTSRAPGAVGAILHDLKAYCGLIIDGVHVDPAVLQIALRARPRDRFMIVTDAMAPVGTDMKSFPLAGREITVAAGRLVDDAGTLAGANLDMATAVRNAVRLLDLDIGEAIAMATAAPAAFLGMGHRRGRIAPGLAADLVWLDAELAVRDTWIAGAAAGDA